MAGHKPRGPLSLLLQTFTCLAVSLPHKQWRVERPSLVQASAWQAAHAGEGLGDRRKVTLQYFRLCLSQQLYQEGMPGLPVCM